MCHLYTRRGGLSIPFLKKVFMAFSGSRSDAVLMSGPTSIMHFCSLPTVTVAFDRKDANGVRQAVILYGTDELRLYAAALTIEALVNRRNV